MIYLEGGEKVFYPMKFKINVVRLRVVVHIFEHIYFKSDFVCKDCLCVVVCV